MITEDIQSNYNSSKMLKYNNKSISKNTLISNNMADIVSDKNEKNERSTDTLMPIRADNDSGKIDYA